jgi:hypothetical protein
MRRNLNDIEVYSASNAPAQPCLFAFGEAYVDPALRPQVRRVIELGQQELRSGRTIG